MTSNLLCALLHNGQPVLLMQHTGSEQHTLYAEAECTMRLAASREGSVVVAASPAAPRTRNNDDYQP
jgi:hypothetical protein